MTGRWMFSILDPATGLFLEARRGRRLPNVFLATAVLLLVLGLGFAGTMIVVTAVSGEEAAEELFDKPWGLAIPFALLVAFLILWVALYEKRSPATIGLAPKGFVRKVLAGMGAGFIMISCTIGLMVLAGCVSVEAGADRLQGIPALGSALLILAVFLVQGGSEEILLRGWYLPVLGARYRPWIGVLVSTVVFAGMHAPTRPIAAVNLLLFGVFTAVYCLREGTVWGVCGWHATWNWGQGNLFGLKVSGHEMFGGTLLNLEGKGPSVLGGGGYGPEGSLFGTIVLFAGIVLVLTLRQRRESESGGQILQCHKTGRKC